ncbi:DeoR family transcriptional regulator, partial [Escherichia coli]
MYLVDERRKLILEDLMSAGTVYVSDLARKYEVTYETIRKDLT